MEIKDYFNEMVRALLSVIEEKDVSIRTNSERIARDCMIFAKGLKLPKGETNKVYLAGLLHDIGMIHLPHEMIQKNEKLDDGEWAMVKMHPEIAEKIIANLSFLKGILPTVRHHHEAVDGSGYPDGLKSDKIPLGARIIRVVESYDAMLHGRAYRPAISSEEALAELQKEAGSRVDQVLVKAFLEYVRLQDASQGAARRNQAKKKKESIRDVIDGIVKRFKEGKIDLPVLPKVVFLIRKAIENPMSTTDDVSRIIERDAVVSLRLITVCNSAMYRGTDKIHTVRQAVPRLGLKQTQSIVTTIANKSLYKTGNEQFMLMTEKLWLHSLASAYAAKSIGNLVQHPDEERLFMMGLIHDVGMALLLKAMDDVIGSQDGFDMQEIEKNLRDVHCDFGSALLQRWKFPGDFVRVAKMHDDLKFSDATQKEILIVNLASILTRSIGYSLVEQEDIDLGETETAQILNVQTDELDKVCDEIRNIMQESAHIF
ncbi:HDOD domain-containing protein [Thermodesulfobacteriota bacterium]